MKITRFIIVFTSLILMLIMLEGVVGQTIPTAKKKIRHHEFGISAGWNFPISDISDVANFPSMVQGMSLSGAKDGLNVCINYTYFPLRWIGVGLLVDINENKFQQPGLPEILERVSYIPGQYYLDVTKWQNYGLRFALDFNIPLFLGLSITARGTIGVSWQFTPEMLLTYLPSNSGENTGNTIERIRYGANSVAGFITGGGIGIKWRIVGPLTIKTNVDYNYSTGYKHELQLEQSVGGENGEFEDMHAPIKFKQNYQAITFTFGLAFSF